MMITIVLFSFPFFSAADESKLIACDSIKIALVLANHNNSMIICLCDNQLLLHYNEVLRETTRIKTLMMLRSDHNIN